MLVRIMFKIVHVHVHVKPECVDDFIAASQLNMRASRKEPGIGRFEIHQRADDPTRFVFIEGFLTPEAQDAHRAAAHYQTWREAVAEMMAEPRQGNNYREIE